MDLVRYTLILCSLFATGNALQCYVCHTQPDNKDKCIKTTKQCTKEKDACMTRIQWKQPPYWIPHAERIHVINKDCALNDDCVATRRALGKSVCKRFWYRDWECVDCCKGDLCNYYVTLSGNLQKPSVLLVALATLTILFYHLR